VTRRYRVGLPRPDVNATAYDEILHAVTDSLLREGASVRTIPTARDAHPGDDLVLIIGTPAYYPSLLADVAALRSRRGKPPLVFLWHLECLPDLDTPPHLLLAYVAKSWWDARRRGRYGNSRGGNFWVIRRGVVGGLFDRILTFTPRKTAFLRRHGIPAESVPVGHHPIWGENRQMRRDIDVLFLGEILDDRRGIIVRHIQDHLAHYNLNFKTMYDFNPIGVWGDERNTILNRTKIFLCIYRFPLDSSGMRLSLGIGNGALVISEPIADPSPFLPNQHFVEVGPSEMPAAILTYLQDDSARMRICDAAATRLNEQYTMGQSVKRILALARTHEQGDRIT
jgi:hypothetical protein